MTYVWKKHAAPLQAGSHVECPECGKDHTILDAVEAEAPPKHYFSCEGKVSTVAMIESRFTIEVPGEGSEQESP